MDKISLMTTIQVSDRVKSALEEMKYKKRMRSLNQVIEHLLTR